jgi:hypothetical protein
LFRYNRNSNRKKGERNSKLSENKKICFGSFGIYQDWNVSVLSVVLVQPKKTRKNRNREGEGGRETDRKWKGRGGKGKGKEKRKGREREGKGKVKIIHLISAVSVRFETLLK